MTSNETFHETKSVQEIPLFMSALIKLEFYNEYLLEE